MAGKTLFIILALLACGSSVAFGRQHPPKDDQGEITVTLDLDGGPMKTPGPYTDKVLHDLIVPSCWSVNGPWFLYFQCFRVGWHAGYEALAHYLHHSKGYLTGGKYRMPKHMRTLANKKTSVYHAVSTALKRAYEENGPISANVDAVMRSVSLNPADNSTDPSTPVGLGNLAGLAVAALTDHEGNNKDGSLGGHEYNKKPWLDYTGYAPVNNPYFLTNKSRWQPQLTTSSDPYSISAQYFAGAHACHWKTFGIESPRWFMAKKPGRWNVFGTPEYREQVETILEHNVRLAYNDTAKVAAEVVDSDPLNTVSFIRALGEKQRWTFDEEVKHNFAIYAAIWDATASIHCNKRTWDCIRPISVIRQSGLFQRVLAYAGPTKGLVDMPAKDWKQYVLGAGRDPEYPSGAVAVLSSFAQMGKLITGSEECGINIRFPKGSAQYELGVPKEDVVLHFPTWESLKEFAKDARLSSGIHFPNSVSESACLSTAVATQTFKWAETLFRGKNIKGA